MEWSIAHPDGSKFEPPADYPFRVWQMPKEAYTHELDLPQSIKSNPAFTSPIVNPPHNPMATIPTREGWVTLALVKKADA